MAKTLIDSLKCFSGFRGVLLRGSGLMNSCGARSIFLAALVGPVLLGCASRPESVIADDLSEATSGSTEAGTSSVYCRGIASERETEATFLHEDARTLHAVYVYTYKACVAWREKHLKIPDEKAIASTSVRQ